MSINIHTIYHSTLRPMSLFNTVYISRGVCVDQHPGRKVYQSKLCLYDDETLSTNMPVVQAVVRTSKGKNGFFYTPFFKVGNSLEKYLSAEFTKELNNGDFDTRTAVLTTYKYEEVEETTALVQYVKDANAPSNYCISMCRDPNYYGKCGISTKYYAAEWFTDVEVGLVNNIHLMIPNGSDHYGRFTGSMVNYDSAELCDIIDYFWQLPWIAGNFVLYHFVGTKHGDFYVATNGYEFHRYRKPAVAGGPLFVEDISSAEVQYYIDHKMCDWSNNISNLMLLDAFSEDAYADLHAGRDIEKELLSRYVYINDDPRRRLPRFPNVDWELVTPRCGEAVHRMLAEGLVECNVIAGTSVCMYALNERKIHMLATLEPEEVDEFFEEVNRTNTEARVRIRNLLRKAF